MKSKSWFCVLIILSNFNLYAQDFAKRLNFVLIIDNKVPQNFVRNGFFVVKDRMLNTKDQLPFEYHVGHLMLTNEGYSKLFTAPLKSIISMEFKFQNKDNGFLEKSYQVEIPPDFINEEYIICGIYHVELNENKLMYYFGGKKMIANIITPNGTLSSAPWGKSVKDKVRLNQH